VNLEPINIGSIHAMPIRMIAQELYRLIQEVERLEKKLKSIPFEKQAKIKDELRKTKAERDRMHAILEGKKEHK
jgi:protein-arginine kinase activator protein McsA